MKWKEKNKEKKYEVSKIKRKLNEFLKKVPSRFRKAQYRLYTRGA
jgi:hypothetical protein